MTESKRLFSYQERLDYFNEGYEVKLDFKDKIIDLTKCKRYSDTHGPIYLNKDFITIHLLFFTEN